MPGPYFTRAEAQRELARIEPLVREIVSLNSSFDAAQLALRAESHRVAMLGGAQPDAGRFQSLRGECVTLAQKLEEAVETLQSAGVLLKDPKLGLIDFPALRNGEDVYLCWKLGEPSIAHWHGIDEGYRGRKPLDFE